MSNDLNETFCNVKLLWTVNVGSKWQIVLPKELRTKLGIESGDSLSVLLKDDKFIWIIRNNDMQELIEFINNK